ncbi:MAG: hypothetical protein RML95_07820 [Anaerolineae bacterium]|nr:hypothetical protein [Anaerolineae bacterium]MDW8299232.1 hypothetical protein [Anaerolineae bacterium]
MRKFTYLAILALFFASLTAAPIAKAQGAPSEAALDRVFQDVSARIGRTVSRMRFDGFWTYEQIVVRDDNLGCPNGQRNAPGQTRAWVVRVTVNGFGSYEYRISNDNSLIFFCTGVGVGANVPPTVAAPPPAAAGGTLPVPPPIGLVSAPVTLAAPILAFVGRDGNVYVTSLSSAQGYVPLTGDAQGFVYEGGYTGGQRNYIHLSWSPDGSRLAFVDQRSQTLFVAASGSPPMPIATGLLVEIPPAWSPDGSQIAYAASTTPSPNPDSLIYNILAVPATGGVAVPAGRIELTVGCLSGGFGPTIINYFQEAGFNGNRTVFKWRGNGFLHTIGCDGSGLALTAFDGTRLWSFPNVTRVRVSPSGASAVALEPSLDFRRGSQVVLLDLAVTAKTPLSDVPVPDQLGWSGDGSTIFLVTRELIQRVAVNSSAPLAASFFALSGESYRLRLFARPLLGGGLQQVYESEGYGIAAITPALNTSLVAFSIVESDVAMIARINANDSYQNVLSAAPRVKIGIAALPLGTPGYPYVIGADGGQPTFSPAMSFTAIPANIVTAPVLPPAVPPVMPAATPTPRPAAPTAVPALRATDGQNPLGLLIGGRAIVPPGAPVIVRSTPQYLPNRSNAISILRPNEVVRILAGPVFADNLRWWQVQREADGLTGWVVDQYIDANGKVETNLQPLR